MSSATQALLSEALFRLPPDRMAAALARLTPGRLWRACLPGIDPALALDAMGADAAATLGAVAGAWAAQDPDGFASAAGLPFRLDVPPSVAPAEGPADGASVSPEEALPHALGAARGEALGRVIGPALAADAEAMARRPLLLAYDGSFPERERRHGLSGEPSAASVLRPDFPGPAVVTERDCEAFHVELTHRPREDWLAVIEACLDHAARLVLEGEMPDPLDALLRSPEGDLFPLLALADADVRLRFAEGLADAEEPSARPADGDDAAGAGAPQRGIDEALARWRHSPFRRSAAASLLRDVERALCDIAGGHTGRGHDGWPAWWRGSAASLDALADAIPPAVLAAAAAVHLVVPRRRAATLAMQAADGALAQSAPPSPAPPSPAPPSPAPSVPGAPGLLTPEGSTASLSVSSPFAAELAGDTSSAKDSSPANDNEPAAAVPEAPEMSETPAMPADAASEAPRFAVVLMPDEARLLVPDWPGTAWLVLSEAGGDRRWAAGPDDGLPALVGALPVWPPLGGFETADVTAEAEAALVRHFQALPGIAGEAKAALETPERPEEAWISAADIDWDP